MSGTRPGSPLEPAPPGAAPSGEPARRTVLALGSNLGDRLATLQGGVDALLGPPGLASSGLALVALSPVYETVPVGGPPQPEYLNAVLIAETTLPAAALLR
ncbi:MAG: 2-amino-4-hydroxy-6-hydroxymethyldihydropteridine diphosphokinase, partial [Streptosporangiaceae bacterium]